MKRIESRSALQTALRPAWAAGRSIGLVPTMGYLHAGHLALVDRARQENDVVVVSIFVNPLQFGPGEDFERYPRDLERDAALLAGRGVDIVYHPPVADVYPEPPEVGLKAGRMAAGLCGRSRPGHFDGVLTVVAKLFHRVRPTRAYFGEKDAQQLALIRRMAFDLDFDVEVVAVPTVREPDGLAMSSRNVYLSPEERAEAPVLYRALAWAAEAIRSGERRAAVLLEGVRTRIAAAKTARIDYVELVRWPDLRPIAPAAKLVPGETVLVAAAVFFGTARLIDNVRVAVPPA
ncbi:MAG: Pantoate--beta-alanine ligase [Hydrogenibacillus schlegelii]|uniref:Pantothenate synthetase n=1 Tax=Hydrogenibacillus schlegelii TaxID=1484 RepID=A0A2T5GE50_HYDSH|nr:pantoate--beta-alanine ligase [Hydrogenibacillus schlegelii]PTQ54464.1 MAG: Pantoate--beta-alanine ligase [Hydrogenibacillus schlegelii]